MKYNVYLEDVSVEAVFNKLGGVGGAKRFLTHLFYFYIKKSFVILKMVVGEYVSDYGFSLPNPVSIH